MKKKQQRTETESTIIYGGDRRGQAATNLSQINDRESESRRVVSRLWALLCHLDFLQHGPLAVSEEKKTDRRVIQGIIDA